jgi:hypothetical protein
MYIDSISFFIHCATFVHLDTHRFHVIMLNSTTGVPHSTAQHSRTGQHSTVSLPVPVALPQHGVRCCYSVGFPWFLMNKRRLPQREQNESPSDKML